MFVGVNGCRASSPTRLSSPSPAGATGATGATSATGATGAPASGPPAIPAPGTQGATTPTTRPVPTTVMTPATTAAPPAHPAELQVGSSGPAVVQLQQRLTSLGYWLGTADGQYGTTTQQAVFALQKVTGLPRSGVIDPATAAALTAGTKAAPKSNSGHLIEVDLAHQLVLIVTNGHLDAALNTSTGGGYVYYDHGSRQVAITPTGHFTTFSEVNGTRVSSLGVLWRPKFFVGGIAIHGDGSVPPRPVSHGCVRVSNQAIDWIWASGSDPIGTTIWVY